MMDSKFGTEIVRMVDISKSFPGVKALDNVSLAVHAGEVHALVGENGAGKSTLIKILMGAYSHDSGEIYVGGKLVDIKSPEHAKQLGLGAVYQDVNLARHLSVGENFFLGKLPTKAGMVDWRSVNTQTKTICEELGVRVNPKMLIRDLTVAQQEMITIAKVVHGNAQLIVFDEPTALLANEETQELFDLITKLKQSGVGIIYISHRMEEIFATCDTVTVLKDGKFVKCMPVADTNPNELVTLMVGRTMEDMYDIKRTEPGETVLEVKGLTKKGVFEDITFDLQRGEILGFFGLVGSGRTDVVRCLFGADKFDGGQILLNNTKFVPASPAAAIKKGIGLLPEDRKQQGLALALPVMQNINMGAYKPISRLGFISLQKEKGVADRYVKSLAIRTPTIYQRVRNLSGGNQQKVVVGRWLNRGSKIFIFDEPTVGVDVGAKGEIYKLFEELVAQGNSIIIVSSYLPEVMGLADRIVVLREGRQMSIVPRAQFNDELLLMYATALKSDETATVK
jgi:ribose transport system ATP-binding protein